MAVEVGARYGRMLVIGRSAVMDRNGKRPWLCRCDCGTEKSVVGQNLSRTRSCGCLRREILIGESGGGRARRHGAAGHGGLDRTSTYNSWSGMLGRCRNRRAKEWEHYGGRGIRVCDRWQGVSGFENFLADMGRKPQGTSLDRIDSNGNYEPSNCRWATALEQAHGKRLSAQRVREVLARYEAESPDLIARLRRDLLG